MELLGLPLLQHGEQFKLKPPGSFMAQCWDSRSKTKKPKNPPRSPSPTLGTAPNHPWRPRAGRTKPRAQRYSQAWAENSPSALPCPAPPHCPQQWGPTSLSPLHWGKSLGTRGAPGKSSAWGREGWPASLHVGITIKLL